MLGSSAAKVGEGSGPEGPFRRLSVLLERRMPRTGTFIYSRSKLKVTRDDEFKAKIPAQFGEDSAGLSQGGPG